MTSTLISEQSAADLSPFPIVKCDADGNPLLMNQSFRRLLEETGLATEEFRRILPPNYPSMLQRCMGDCARNAVKANVENRTLQFNFVPSPSGNGAFIFINDFTKEEEARTQWMQAEKMAALGQLVGGIAHEINTPIGAIHSSNDVLTRSVEKLRQLLGKSPEDFDVRRLREVHKILDILAELAKNNTMASDRIVHLVRNLKNFVRLDEAQRKTVDIHEGLESTLTLVHHQFKNRIQVVRRYSPVTPIECFPNQLNQVFMNLLVNASQAIPDRGTITIRTYEQDGQVKIDFTDTGVGIQPKDLPKLFDPGFTTKGAGVGTGLGLSICYKIIKDHHGKIEVRSEPGAGSTFSISLPIAPNKESHAG